MALRKPWLFAFAIFAVILGVNSVRIHADARGALQADKNSSSYAKFFQRLRGCSKDDCQNGGTCGPDGICICAPGYDGELCQNAASGPGGASDGTTGDVNANSTANGSSLPTCGAQPLLKSLLAKNCALDPPFQPGKGIRQFACEVSESTRDVSISVVPAIDGIEVEVDPILSDLQHGPNAGFVEVRCADMKRRYKFSITRAFPDVQCSEKFACGAEAKKAICAGRQDCCVTCFGGVCQSGKPSNSSCLLPDVTLSSLKVSNGCELARFRADNYFYECSVSAPVTSVFVTATPNDPNAHVEISGHTSITSQSNKLQISVSNANQWTPKPISLVYTVDVRKVAEDAASAQDASTGIHAGPVLREQINAAAESLAARLTGLSPEQQVSALTEANPIIAADAASRLPRAECMALLKVSPAAIAQIVAGLPVSSLRAALTAAGLAASSSPGDLISRAAGVDHAADTARAAVAAATAMAYGARGAGSTGLQAMAKLAQMSPVEAREALSAEPALASQVALGLPSAVLRATAKAAGLPASVGDQELAGALSTKARLSGVEGEQARAGLVAAVESFGMKAYVAAQSTTQASPSATNSGRPAPALQQAAQGGGWGPRKEDGSLEGPSCAVGPDCNSTLLCSTDEDCCATCVDGTCARGMPAADGSCVVEMSDRISDHEVNCLTLASIRVSNGCTVPVPVKSQSFCTVPLSIVAVEVEAHPLFPRTHIEVSGNDMLKEGNNSVLILASRTCKGVFQQHTYRVNVFRELGPEAQRIADLKKEIEEVDQQTAASHADDTTADSGANADDDASAPSVGPLNVYVHRGQKLTLAIHPPNDPDHVKYVTFHPKAGDKNVVVDRPLTDGATVIRQKGLSDQATELAPPQLTGEKPTIQHDAYLRPRYGSVQDPASRVALPEVPEQAAAEDDHVAPRYGDVIAYPAAAAANKDAAAASNETQSA